jgi:hypothetical protein
VDGSAFSFSGYSKGPAGRGLVRQLLKEESGRYDRFQKVEFAAYLTELNQHYSIEKRWPTSAFWRIPTENLGNDGRVELSLTNCAI